MAKSTDSSQSVNSLAKITAIPSAIRHVLIGNPANRRVTLFQQALQKHCLRPADVISYVDLLTGRRSLEDALCSVVSAREWERQPVFLRIDSPGEDFDVEKLLIARGAGSDEVGPQAAHISQHAALRLRCDHGRILFPDQWFAGYRSLLSEIALTALRHPHVRFYNHPEEIIRLFDKPACHRILDASANPVTPAFFKVESFDDLQSRMKKHDWPRVFVKLASGSSASGVIALYVRGKVMRAVTSMEIVGTGARTKFYNNLNLRTYHRLHEIRRAVDFLCREQAHVERWLPKATVRGRQFDLRVLVIAGTAQHVVMRTSSGPITNLHLGNRRGDVDHLRQQMAGVKWQAVTRVAEQAAKSFSRSICVGFDILLKPGLREPTILEANAFGDLLPGIKCQGLSTHEAQVAAAIQSASLTNRLAHCSPRA